MKKGFVFVLLALLSLSLVSAHSNYYDVDDSYTYKEKIVESKYYPSRHQTYSKTTYINYDNDKRYSTYEYKYGYSYRTTVNYRDRHYKKMDYDRDYERDYYRHKSRYRDSKDYYYDYVPHLREFQKKECYHEAPKGKLFYIKCP
jgi:hypothetical protein